VKKHFEKQPLSHSQILPKNSFVFVFLKYFLFKILFIYLFSIFISFWSSNIKNKFKNILFQYFQVKKKNHHHNTNMIFIGLEVISVILACLRMWLQLFFKVFFTRKCIKIIFIYFLKIIFDIGASKWSKNIKKY